MRKSLRASIGVALMSSVLLGGMSGAAEAAAPAKASGVGTWVVTTTNCSAGGCSFTVTLHAVKGDHHVLAGPPGSNYGAVITKKDMEIIHGGKPTSDDWVCEGKLKKHKTLLKGEFITESGVDGKCRATLETS